MTKIIFKIKASTKLIENEGLLIFGNLRKDNKTAIVKHFSKNKMPLKEKSRK